MTAGNKELRLGALREALASGTLRPAQRMVAAMHPAEVASMLESLPPRQRELVWEFVDKEIEGDVLVELNENVRNELIEEMETAELVAAAEGMELDDLADLVRDLPETVTLQVLRSMDQRDRERLRNVLAWPDDSAGGLMNTDTVSVRPDVTLEVVLRYLRMRGDLPPRTDSLFVVDRDDRYLGTIGLTRIITGDPDDAVGDSLDTDAPRIEPDTAAHEVAQLFQDRDLVSAAVVGREGKLLGRITVDDVVDVIREEAEHSVLSMAGLQDDEDLFAAIVPSAQRRMLWLGINLVTAFLAASVVKSFEGTIEKVAALAALMPIVASMGGIAGTQTVTLLIRGLALGQVQWANARWLLFKEIAVAGFNGIIWAVVVGMVTVFWFGTWKIAGVIAATLVFSVRTELLEKFAIPLLGLGALLLVLVLIPGIGYSVNGSRRWIRLVLFNVQVSEIVRVLVLIFVASYAVRRETELRTSVVGLLKPLAVLGLFFGLLLLEPDFGAAVVLVATSFGVLFLAGARLRDVIGLAVLGAALLGSLGVIAGLWADKFDQMAAFQNFVIMPMTFLSGVFYSIHSLPAFWQGVSHLNPFFYMIDGFRYGFFGLSDVSPWVSLSVLLVALAARLIPAAASPEPADSPSDR